MAAPRQMTAQTLNALKGWPQMAAVDFHAEIDSVRLAALYALKPAGSTAGQRLQAGSVVHIDATTGKFQPGVGKYSVDHTGQNTPGTDSLAAAQTSITTGYVSMPMFMFNASDDPDVSNDGGDPSTVKGAFIAISPTGQAMALVAVGAYELVTTAYVAGQAYAPNKALTSSMADTNAGLIQLGTVYTDMICGICSRGVVDNGYGTDAVAFWPTLICPHA